MTVRFRSMLFLFTLTSAAFAVPIKYTLTGYAVTSGGGTGQNTPSSFVWTVSADTGAITNPAPGMYQVPAITSNITFVGVKSTGLSGVTVYLDTNTGVVTFGNIPGGGIALSATGLTSYGLTTPIGSVNGTNVLVAGSITESPSGFTVTISSVANTNNGPSPTFQAALASPEVTNLANSASNIAQGLPNAAIAQGSIFIIQGIDLGPASISLAPVAFQSTTLSTTSVSVTVGATTTNLPLYYTSAGQIAALLPSNVPVGAGTITVSYAGQTGRPVPIIVVANNLGLFTIDSSGEGAGIVTFADYSLVSDAKGNPCGGPNTYCGAANPGEALILWGTGLGPVSGNDVSGAGLGVAINTPLTLWVGGVQAAVSYQGRSGCCVGEDQIVFTVPSNVPTGCAVPLVAQLGSGISNVIEMPIAPAGSRTCTPTNPAFAAANLVQASTAGTVGNIAQISVSPGGTGNADNISLLFASITAYQPGAGPYFTTYLDDLPQSTCYVVNNVLNPFQFEATGGNAADAGSTFTVKAAGGTQNVPSGNSTLSMNGSFLTAGPVTVSGTGGANIGAFSATSTISAAPVLTSPSLNNLVVTRANGFTVTWSGGSANTTVQIYLGSATDNTGLIGAQVVCQAPASAGKFTVPPYILSALPAGTNGAFNFSPFLPEVPVTASGLLYGELVTNLPGALAGMTVK